MLRVGIFDHFGWAVAVTASPGHGVVDRRRIELVEPGVTPAPIHYESRALSLDETSALVASVRGSIHRASSAALTQLAAELPGPVSSLSLRTWPANFPADIEVLRRVPYESRADAVMYRQVLAEIARGLGWHVFLYNAKDVTGQVAALLADRATDILDGPRQRLGPPWTRDHRMALAAAIVAGDGGHEKAPSASEREGAPGLRVPQRLK